MKRVIFSDHAEIKFQILKDHGFIVSKQMIRKAFIPSQHVEQGYGGRKILQTPYDQNHVLRIVFEEKGHEVKIITFYPGRKTRYENKI